MMQLLFVNQAYCNCILIVERVLGQVFYTEDGCCRFLHSAGNHLPSHPIHHNLYNFCLERLTCAHFKFMISRWHIIYQRGLLWTW